MHHRLSGALFLIGALLSLLLQPLATVTAQTPEASPAVSGSSSIFVPRACTTTLPAPFVAGENASCGTVNVPAYHDQADSPQFTLYVTVLKSTSPDPAPEPLFILTGGPGQSSAAVLPLFGDDAPLYKPLLERQDVVLIDQRGTGYSLPGLVCSIDRISAAPAESATPAATPVLDPAQVEDQILGCGDDLRARGIDLGAFNTTESAADIADIAHALAAPQVDLYGISYGTYLGQVVMRDHPEIVRSAILSSPLPLDANVFSGQVIGFDQALKNIFAVCAADPECEGAFPNIETDFSSLIASLQQQPITVNVTDPASGQVIPVPVDAATFTQLLYLSVFVGPLIPVVVPMIGATAQGDTSVLEQILPIVLSIGGSAGTRTGVLYSMFCNDEAPYTTDEATQQEIADAGVLPELADESIYQGVGANIFDICAAWGIAPQPGNQNDAVTSDIPTLIATGAYDPITPPAYGEELQGDLANSFLVEFANQGHDPLSNVGECGLTVIETFLTDPATGPDTECVAGQILDLTPLQPEATPAATPVT